MPIYQTVRRQNPEYYNLLISRSDKEEYKCESKRVNKKAKQNGDEILREEVRRVMKDGSADSRDVPFAVCFAKIRTVDSTALRNTTAAANQKWSTFSAQHVYRHVILYWEELINSCVSGGISRTFQIHCSLINIPSATTQCELPTMSPDKTHTYKEWFRKERNSVAYWWWSNQWTYNNVTYVNC